jgi:hypothetical protein
MIKTTLLSLSLWLFAIATTLAQTADVIYLFDGKVVLGDIKKALYPLREAKIDINTEFGSQTYFLDQIDSVRENGIMYKKLSYRLGRETYQSLGKPYFKGDWILYETDLWKTVEVHVMEVDGRTLALTEENYWPIFRNYIDPNYETRPIKYFDPVFLSDFSVKYHETKGLSTEEAIIHEQ